MFIQTEATPNPATLKFLPGRTVLAHGTLDIRDADAAAQSPLAERLFGIDGRHRRVPRLRLHHGHQVDGEWQHLKPAILGAIMEHFMSGAPSCSTKRHRRQAADDEFFETKDTETVATIKELIETRVRPAVANDGGDITFRGFRDGVVYLDMKGACSGCPSSTATLQARHPEPAAPLRSGRGRSPPDELTSCPPATAGIRTPRHFRNILKTVFTGSSAFADDDSTGYHARPRHRHRACGLRSRRARHPACRGDRQRIAFP